MGGFARSDKVAITTMISVLNGDHDRALLCVLAFNALGKVFPTKESDLEDLRVTAALERIKQTCRDTIQEILETSTDHLERAEKARIDDLNAKRHAPDEGGTTAQIAARLGISKAEVRRRRAAAQLGA